MHVLRPFARRLGRQPWLSAAGPRLITVDMTLQRWTRGRVAFSSLAGMTAVLLTATGRRTGQPRTTPLMAIPDDGSLILVASNWGKPHHPAWSANLIAHPAATAQVRGHDFPVTATLLTDADRAAAWHTVTTAWPAYHDYATRSGREIRLFRLTLR
ncbi:nitroreductase family deazaflavin-dependent oxidoreductase [Actinophytocola sp.]|uniref:nitroreductase family deazaflavin-dependent oxidoreductase n=1 Tax=Actinophytocola sp. TaxID=1872138 RepID=UPI002D80016F|nr:nitroreductase family deazaflavin-dependent oxidoreductase [Actinophytocola sp.]HET9139655.1 nitroreductase family deazaflavin-dependent oxidoreductase [Actinophytocola sp.]